MLVVSRYMTLVKATSDQAEESLPKWFDSFIDTSGNKNVTDSLAIKIEPQDVCAHWQGEGTKSDRAINASSSCSKRQAFVRVMQTWREC
jgi:hypothetical protein